MKIAICGLLASQNMGEWLIADSLKYLIEKEYPADGQGNKDLSFVYVDILANNDEIVSTSNPLYRRLKNCYKYRLTGLPAEGIDTILKKLAKRFKLNKIYALRHWIWWHCYNYKPRFSLYYDERFKSIDAIIVDGAGLLEYSANEYQEPLLLISKFGEKLNVPVIYNAIGRSGEYDPTDQRCQVLMQALRSPAVKYISARDSVETVQLCAGTKHYVKLLADAAFWCREAYSVEKRSVRGLVGIGVIRGDALLRYNTQFGKDNWVHLFSTIGQELELRGYQYFYFTNGMPADYEIIDLLKEQMNLSRDQYLQRPVTGKELMDIISVCDGIITCRMHSSIAATSLGIPSVVLTWNEKIKKYFAALGYPNRAVNVNEFVAKGIVDRFEKSLSEGIQEQSVENLKQLALESVDDYMDILLSCQIHKNSQDTFQ